MRHRPVVALLTLMIAMILALPTGARQKPVAPTPAPAGVSATSTASTPAKPFTQDQVQSMVRAGLGDETGAKAIEQRGLDFVPTQDFLQSLKTAGANEAFLEALRAAKHPQPAGETTKKPLNQVQVFALLAGQVPSHRVAMLVQERGIDFEPTDEYLEEVRLGGGESELIRALKTAKVTRPEHVDPAAQARQEEIQQHARLGALYLRNKGFAEAESEFRAAVRLDPENPALHFDLGWVLAQGRDWDGAITEYREALRLDPGNDGAHLDLGIALGIKGDWEGMVAEQREAVHLNPNNESAHFALGVALGQRGDWGGAVQEWREAVRLDPKNELAHHLLGYALEKEGDRDGALQEYRAAHELKPQDPDYREDYERLLKEARP